MKKSIIVIILILNCSAVHAQDQKFKLKSLNIGFGGFSIKNDFAEGGGALLIGDLTTSFNNNLFTASILTGSEIGIIGNSNYGFNEFSLLYGRELKLANWFSFEAFAGVGFYNQNSLDFYIQDGNSISFPLKINSKFYFNKKFGMGINANYSVNNINNNFSTNLIFHWRYD